MTEPVCTPPVGGAGETPDTSPSGETNSGSSASHSLIEHPRADSLGSEVENFNAYVREIQSEMRDLERDLFKRGSGSEIVDLLSLLDKMKDNSEETDKSTYKSETFKLLPAETKVLTSPGEFELKEFLSNVTEFLKDYATGELRDFTIEEVAGLISKGLGKIVGTGLGAYSLIEALQSTEIYRERTLWDEQEDRRKMEEYERSNRCNLPSQLDTIQPKKQQRIILH